MIRAEVKTKTKSFVFCEGTEEEARAYIEALKDNGVEIVNVEYFDNDERIAAIQNGEI